MVNSNPGGDNRSARGRPRKVILATVFILVALVAMMLLGPREKEQAIKPMGVNGSATSRDGTRIAFTKMGSGPPLVPSDQRVETHRLK